MTDLNKYNLIEGFKSIGVKQGDTILVHSSLRSLGYVVGGAAAVVDSLLSVIGEEGTLIVPTLTGKREDSALNPPEFDVENTSCWTGIIPETVRKAKESKRSLHPTHSVAAIGFKKDYITKGHECSESPCDKASPYYKNAILNGHILLIGVDQESNTSIHSCEEISGVPYHLQKDITEVDIVDYQGKKVRVANRLHDWNKPETDFNKLDGLYMQQGIMQIEKIGNAVVRYLNANTMFAYTIDLLMKEPMFLIK